MTSMTWKSSPNATQFLLGKFPLLALLALCAATALLADRFLSPMNITNILLQASVISVSAMGMTFVIISGGFDLSVGAVVALSGTIAAWVMLETHWVIGIVAGILVGAIVGFVNGIVITRLKVSPFIATLGMIVVIRGIALLITDGRPIVGEDGLPGPFLELARGRLFNVHLLIWLWSGTSERRAICTLRRWSGGRSGRSGCRQAAHRHHLRQLDRHGGGNVRRPRGAGAGGPDQSDLHGSRDRSHPGRFPPRGRHP